MVKNGQLLAIFNSAHRVMKAENILKQSGLQILLIVAPRALSTDCGLAVLFDAELLEKVKSVLDSNDTPPVTIYRKESDTTYLIIWDSDKNMS